MVHINYSGFPPRPRGMYPLVRDVFDAEALSSERYERFADVPKRAQLPFVGITNDGRVRGGLFSLADEGFDVAHAYAAATDLLDTLTTEERRAITQPLDSVKWRVWTNAYPVWPAHGVLLQDVSMERREAVLALVRACLSELGAAEVRACMRLNAVLGEVVEDYPGSLTEWMYRFSLFGTPSGREPWGWQLIGHHVDVHCMIIGRQLVLTPTFLGAEPRIADRGSYRGLRVFDEQLSRGLELMNSLDGAQQLTATLCRSVRSADLPSYLNHPSEGRMRAVLAADNLVLGPEGVSAMAMSAKQQSRLLAVIESYFMRLPSSTAELARMAEVERYLDDTYFAWVGTMNDNAPFYYKIHSPVTLIELDCHRGVFIANDEPEQFHVHTVVRTPNGNDYGRDLLRQHHAAHSHQASV